MIAGRCWRESRGASRVSIFAPGRGSEAERLGLDGWVRNEHDGSVSALIAGEAQAVTAMLERFRSGPPSARVSGIATQEAALGEAALGFRIVG